MGPVLAVFVLAAVLPPWVARIMPTTKAASARRPSKRQSQMGQQNLSVLGVGSLG